GYDEFRFSQEKIINNILSGRDVLAIMPTGSGKSLCYQIPAMLLEGTTIVISPLISLMKDQVDVLLQMGIPSSYINSSLDFDELLNRQRKLTNGEYKLVYIAPERLSVPSFMSSLTRIKISQIAVDESHCISQWGHDFRPEYRQISQLIKGLKSRPIVTAFTATATEECKNDIIDQLELINPYIEISSFDRPNIFFSVIKNSKKDDELYSLLSEGESTIIYAATRKTVEKIYGNLMKRGKRVGKYHGGMTADLRDNMQDMFLYDQIDIMVATLAFGMGIDKPDVRKVIHYNMPKSLENFYQEAGRAGRDGLESESIILYSPSDKGLQQFIIQNDSNFEDSIKKLESMDDYCNTKSCLRKYILNYFGENAKNCNNCINCETEFFKRDITLESKKILSCIHKMVNNYGKTMLCDVLMGRNTARIRQNGFNEISTYGIMKDYSKDEIMEMIFCLIKKDLIFVDNFNYNVLSLNKKSYDFLKSDELIFMQTKKPEENLLLKTKQHRREIPKDDENLFEKIRLWRLHKALERSVPPFVIFNDQTIYSLIEIMPKTIDELTKVKGIGEKKKNDFGKDLLDLIWDRNNKEVYY
ncbi:MAG: DNA helicase RecQ, partial [Tissierellia bacterium]|nr:DNA helicase RecQ [Tissierellia bacterium]